MSSANVIAAWRIALTVRTTAYRGMAATSPETDQANSLSGAVDQPVRKMPPG